MDLNWKQSDSENRCVDLIITTLMFHKACFDFNIDNSRIYFIPNSPHMHRTQWEQEDIIIIFESKDEIDDVLQIHGKHILNRLGNIYCVGTTRKDTDLIIEEMLGNFMHGMSAEEIRPYKKYINIFTVNSHAVDRALKLKCFW
jgi:hypothetical protein